MNFGSRGLHFFATFANERNMKKYLKILMVGIMSGLTIFAGGMSANADEPRATLPELYFQAVNSGYVIDGINNVGELIEIARGGDSDEMISLAGVTVRYTNTSGNETDLVKFPENSFLAGEKILLRLASSPGSELANLTYTKTLAMNAGLSLWRGEELLDTVCFTGKGDCYKAFDKNAPTTLVRNLATGEFEHLESFEPVFVAESYVLKEEEEEGKGAVAAHCQSLQFSEILSYYAEAQTEQFVEIYNAGAEQVLLNGCTLKYKDKFYPLTGIVKPEEYYVRWADDFKLTKDPANYNTLEIIDEDGTVVDELVYSHGQKKGLAYALIGYDENGEEVWHTTYAATPGEENVYQEYRTCEEGKVINEETGNCVKVSAVAEKTCEAGQYLNPLTGRCKKIETETEKVCQEGYYLYAPTGRCRKVVENDGAEYDIAAEDGETQEEMSLVAVYTILAVLGIGLAYIIYEYRKEIGRIFRRIFQR